MDLRTYFCVLNSQIDHFAPSLCNPIANRENIYLTRPHLPLHSSFYPLPLNLLTLPLQEIRQPLQRLLGLIRRNVLDALEQMGRDLRIQVKGRYFKIARNKTYPIFIPYTFCAKLTCISNSMISDHIELSSELKKLVLG